MMIDILANVFIPDYTEYGTALVKFLIWSPEDVIGEILLLIVLPMSVYILYDILSVFGFKSCRWTKYYG